MQFNFLEKLALYILEGMSSSVLPDIALQGLKEGYDRPSLVVLAGLRADHNSFLVDEYLKQLLTEVNIDLSNKEKAAIYLIKSIVEKILNNRVDPYNGCEFLFAKILGLTDFRKQDNRYVYDSIGLAEVYSLYVGIEELMKANIKWDDIKTNEQLIREAKDEIKTKFCDWNKNHFIITS